MKDFLDFEFDLFFEFSEINDGFLTWLTVLTLMYLGVDPDFC